MDKILIKQEGERKTHGEKKTDLDGGKEDPEEGGNENEKIEFIEFPNV